VGERDEDLDGAGAAQGEEGGVVVLALILGEAGIEEEGDEGLAQARGDGERARAAGGVGGAGEEQGEEMEDQDLERARNAGAVLPPCPGGGGARADRRPGLG
jgi:hypothetical protein